MDTNVLVYAADRTAPAHAHCRALLEAWRRQSSIWYTTWPILYEFMRVTTHPSVFDSPWTAQEAWGFVRAVLAAPGLVVLTETDRHPGVLDRCLAEVALLRGNLLHDAHTAVLMREHGIRRIYTRDTDFYHFPWVTSVDPLRES